MTTLRLAAIGLLFLWVSFRAESAVVNVNTVAGLVAAVNNGAAGDTINVAAGTYELTASLTPKANMTLKGAGMSLTTLRAGPSWVPGTAGLPDNAVVATSAVRSAYLFDLGTNDALDISDMTLDGSGQLHGVLYGDNADSLNLHGLFVKDTIWSGIRTWRMSNTLIHDCIFEDAGGIHSGTTGGGLYLTWTEDSQFSNNRFYRSAGSPRPFYGIKGRESRRCRMNNNTITTNFSIEWPHENDYDTEIDHNYMTGTVSLPKNGGGGTVPASGVTFHIHHNYFRSSYSLEWGRNGAEVDHNLFDFLTTSDGGNLISSWSDVAQGPTKFHDNLIKNPGRGLFWTTNVYNNYAFYNNHVIANKTVTPRTEGLFGFPSTTTFSTITIKDNIIECIGQNRPLVRTSASFSAVIHNNTLTGISDTASYANPNTGATRGPLAPLLFNCGVNGEFTVDQWIMRSTSLGIFTAAADIGAVAASGFASESSGIYLLQGSGADIGNAADEFQFVSKDHSGDALFIAKVDSITNTNAAAKAGIMFRDGAAANAKNAFVAVTPSNGVTFQVRASAGGATTSQTTTGLTAPKWLKLLRAGDVFTAFHSADGLAWTQVGTANTVTIAASAKAGLAVTSHADGTLCAAQFSDVSLTNGLVATPGFSVAGGEYASAQSVTISTTTASASIRYTMDGSAPSSTAGSVYSGAVNVGASVTLKAIAYKSGMTDSAVASASYTINPYFGDGIPDDWQWQYFGPDNPNAAPDVDASGTGQNNLFKYVAGLNPIDPASRFIVTIPSGPGQPGQMRIIFFPVVTGRTYKVLAKENLTDPTWVELIGATESDDGGLRTVTDHNVSGSSKFYRVQITNP